MSIRKRVGVAVLAACMIAGIGYAETLGDPNVDINGQLNVDNGTLFVDAVNNRLGVGGVTVPGYDFHLRKFNPGGFVDFLVQNNGPGGTARFVVQSPVRSWIWTAGSDGRYSLYGTGGAGNAFIVDNNANIGVKVGVNQPGAALTVGGVLHCTSTASASIMEIRGGSDFAEAFHVSTTSAEIIPGTVCSIDPARPGELIVSTEAYDRRVAGVISGAGGLNAGVVMGQKGSIADGEYPVALSGRVYVLADATFGAIEAGDLLTTSHTPGHAMKVSDFEASQGASIGKAMTSLAVGEKGLVLVLVNLH